MNDKIGGLLVCVLILVFGLSHRVSSQGEIKVLPYVDQQQILKIELVVPREVEEVTVELINAQGEMTHYLTLKSPMIQKHRTDYRNIFYITREMADLTSIEQINVRTKENLRVQYRVSELETISVEGSIAIEASAVSQPLKVMTYNIHHGKDLIGRNSLEEIAALIRDSGAEIIGLQEVDSWRPRSGMMNQLKYLGESLDMYYAYGENMNMLTSRYGNGVLSKYPIVSSQNLLLPSQGEQRGLLNAVIDVNGVHMNFLVTHLGLNQEERQKQVESILAYKGTLDEEVFLLGDFNSSIEEIQLKDLKKIMIDTGAVAGAHQIVTFDFPLVSKRIDYIFAPSVYQVSEYQVIQSRASDHYPVMAILKKP